MGGVLMGLTLTLGPAFGVPGWRWLALLVLISAGSAAYFLFGHLIGAFRLQEFKGAMRR